MARILLIAPETELRRSLEFALAVEGHEVTSRASIAAHERPDYDCTVLDHHAAGTNLAAAGDFLLIHSPVILLANQATHPLSPWAFRTLLKPLLGASLTNAVHEALAGRASAT
ncbi:MAG TPA: hypothetical protein VHA10_07260 [Hypericibacter adhaerens]|uniref:hypothetical protein n=1 Tax=Hypericibacter adhaerens TaxID=2602016 RepID=UPI002D0F7B73|nr:hypothetical protein [Hypericibacter adhaerens]HWA42992.1 hypothetical protein [Hypericibacter adhaerens]